MAKRPYLTTSESSEDRDRLLKIFKSLAEKSLTAVIEQLNARSLYAKALKQIEQGTDLSDELPELRTLPKPNAIRVIKSLIKDADAQIDLAWTLDSRYADLFKSSIRVRHLEGELFPSFDVEYEADSDAGKVLVSVITARRIPTVKVSGNEEAIRYVTKRLLFASLR